MVLEVLLLDAVVEDGDCDDSIKCGLACTTNPTVFGVSVIAATYRTDDDDDVAAAALVDGAWEQVANPTILAFLAVDSLVVAKGDDPNNDPPLSPLDLASL